MNIFNRIYASFQPGEIVAICLLLIGATIFFALVARFERRERDEEIDQYDEVRNLNRW